MRITIFILNSHDITGSSLILKIKVKKNHNDHKCYIMVGFLQFVGIYFFHFTYFVNSFKDYIKYNQKLKRPKISQE